jgi:hypothetical protein
MLTLLKKSQLESLHRGNVKESLTLEYKASAAVDKRDDAKKLEIARDVCAFANADGGQIVYGMTEHDHEPAGLDDGIDGSIYPEIWFEQVLQQHITPPIPGLRIRYVPLNKPMVAVVIDIPASKADPHQVSDGRYYRRHNFNRLIMEHYEVRNAMRRSVDPDLVLEFDLLVGKAAPAKDVKAYVKRNKNDAADAEAICEAVRRPTMRFVPVKSAEQQAQLMQHRARDLLMRQRTQMINALRAHLAELGITAAQGREGIRDLLAIIADEADARLPIDARASLIVLAAQLQALQTLIGSIEKRIVARHRSSEASKRLQTIPGVGILGASAIATIVTEPKAFRSGRDFAAWVGLVPRQDSTGGLRIRARG